MWGYFSFYRDKGWHPRQVDELLEDEEYWLPIMEGGANEAEAIWSEIKGN